jgi:hypothetical protein
MYLCHWTTYQFIWKRPQRHQLQYAFPWCLISRRTKFLCSLHPLDVSPLHDYLWGLNILCSYQEIWGGGNKQIEKHAKWDFADLKYVFNMMFCLLPYACSVSIILQHKNNLLGQEVGLVYIFWATLYWVILQKLSLCFNWTPRHEGVLGEWRYSATHSLISALDGSEWSASGLAALPPGKEPLVPLG